MINKQLIKIAGIALLNIILVVFIIRWLLLNVDFKLIINESMSLEKTSVITSVLIGMLLYLFYGLRMALLLDTRVATSTQIVILGFGLNAFLPFRLGDVLKIVIAKQFFKIDLTKTSFATILEKVLDLIVISCLTLIFIVGNTKYYAALILILGGVTLYIGIKSNSIFNIKNILVNKFLSIMKLMLAKDKHKAIIFCTVSIWSLTCLVFYIFFSMNMSAGSVFTVFDAITLLIFTTLSLSIPSMPASIGIFESGIVYYLTHHFHFIAEKAVAYAILFHLMMIIPQIIFTVIILIINTISSERLGAVSNGV